MIHELKTWPLYFNAVARGDKTFEIRKDDRPFMIGDELVLKEFNAVLKKYTGSPDLRFKVTYILAREPFVPRGYVCMAIKPIVERERESKQSFSQCAECGQFYPDGYGFDYCPYCGKEIEELK